MRRHCVPSAFSGIVDWVSGVSEAAKDIPLVESDPAQALVKGGEVHRIRQQAVAAPAPRRQFDGRNALIACFLLCAVLAGAIGIASRIDLSPRIWSGLAVAMSAAAGLLALLPRLELRVLALRIAKLTLLFTVLAAALLTGAAVSMLSLPPWIAAAALCAPPDLDRDDLEATLVRDRGRYRIGRDRSSPGPARQRHFAGLPSRRIARPGLAHARDGLRHGHRATSTGAPEHQQRNSRTGPSRPRAGAVVRVSRAGRDRPGDRQRHCPDPGRVRNHSAALGRELSKPTGSAPSPGQDR